MDLKDKKIEALATFLDICGEDAEELIDSEDYLVLTDNEADELTKEIILNSLWAFNSEFLGPWCEIPVRYLRRMQEDMCENCNEIVKRFIGDEIDGFIEEAINLDGRGHFISQYDGEENEEEIRSERLFIYRQN